MEYKVRFSEVMGGVSVFLKLHNPFQIFDFLISMFSHYFQPSLLQRVACVRFSPSSATISFAQHMQ